MVMMASTMLVRLIVVMMMVKLVMVMISEMTMTMMKMMIMMIMVVIRRKTVMAVEHFFCRKQGDKFKMRQNGIAL